MYFMPPVLLWEDVLVRRLTIPDVVSDANLNTLVELSDVQFTEVAGRHYFEEANNVGGATNWSLIDKFGNQILLELVVMLILLKRWFLLAAEGERRFDQIRFGLSVASSFRKDVVITAPSSVLFSQDFKPWLIKPI
jgi:hypothetical protein